MEQLRDAAEPVSHFQVHSVVQTLKSRVKDTEQFQEIIKDPIYSVEGADSLTMEEMITLIGRIDTAETQLLDMLRKTQPSLLTTEHWWQKMIPESQTS